MSENWGGHGWWMASDGKWYPPEDRTHRPSDASDSLDENEIDLRDDDASEIPGESQDASEPVVVDLRAGAELSELQPAARAVPQPAASAVPQPAARSRDRVSVRAGATVGPTSSTPFDRSTSPSADRAPRVMTQTLDESTPAVSTIPDDGHGVRNDESSRFRGWMLLTAAVVLAVACGILGALWQRAEARNADLVAELDAAQAPVAGAGTAEELAEIQQELDLAQEENVRLRAELDELRPLLSDVPAERFSVLEVPFVPSHVSANEDWLVTVSGDGEWLAWTEDPDGPPAAAGQVEGAALALLVDANEVLVATDAAQIEQLPVPGARSGRPLDLGSVDHLVSDGPRFWTFSTTTNELLRVRRSDRSIRASVELPEPITDLTAGAGTVWALGESGIVYSVNTADFRVSAVDAGEDVISITAGPDTLWALSAADGSLRRIDPVSGAVLVTVPVGRDPVDAVFAGTSVWVGLRSGATLIEVDTRTSAVVSRTSLPAEPEQLFDGGSSVYVTVVDETSPVVRVESG